MDFNMNAAAAAGTTTTTASPRSPRPPQPTTLATGPFSPRKRAAHTAATMFVDRLIEDATGHDDDIDEDGAAPHHDDTDADATDADTASIVVEILQPVSVSRRTSPVRTARISIPPPSTTSTTSKQAKPTPPTAPTFTPTPGRLVWAKIGRFPYWPGQVVDAAVYDPRGLIAKPSSGGGGGGGRGRKTAALSVKAPVHHLVHFYGTHDFAYVTQAHCQPLDYPSTDFDERARKGTTISFKKALVEVRRVVEEGVEPDGWNVVSAVDTGDESTSASAQRKGKGKAAALWSPAMTAGASRRTSGSASTSSSKGAPRYLTQRRPQRPTTATYMQLLTFDGFTPLKRPQVDARNEKMVEKVLRNLGLLSGVE